MSAAASPRSTRSHDRSASRTGNTPSLPSKFRVPPTPPRIHKRLRMTIEEDGLLLCPANDDGALVDQGILIEWGLKKAIRRFDSNALSADRMENVSTTPTKKSINSASTTIEIGGILGRSHLWETSYLLFFLPPPDLTPNKLFPSTKERQFPEELPSVTPFGSAEDELRKLYLASGGDNASPANRRERSESTATVKQGYAGLYRRDTISGPSSGKHGDPDPQDGSQGEFHTLKSVYALALRKEDATEMINKLNVAMAKSKPKGKQSTDSTPSTSTPNTDNQSTGHTSGTTTPADTPGRLFVKALNPQSWNLSIPLPGLTRNSSFEKAPLVPTASGASSGTPSSTSETKEAEDELLANASAEETSATKEATADGMPDPDAVMASVAGIQPLDGQKIATPLSRWAGMDKFIAGSGAAARAVGKGFNDMGKGLGAIGRRKTEDSLSKEGMAEQSVSLMEDDAASETSESLADDMMPPEGGILLNLPGKVTPGATGDQRAQPPSIAKASVSQRKDLEAKIVREMCRELGSGAFFYSHEVDLSHTLQHKRRQLTARSQSQGLLTSLLHRDDSSSSRDSLGLADSPTEPDLPPVGLEPAADITGPDFSGASDEKDGGATWIEPDMNLPLWRRFDQRFMWNTWLLKEFVDLGLHEYILPVMQGWVQSSRFYIPPSPDALSLGSSPVPRGSTSSFESLLPPPSTPVDLVVISRRSKDRAGLRFQRRGIDEDGNVANFVETEMIIRVKVEDKWNIFSFVIIRGSIPLFWSQTSTLTAMKPAPVLDRPVKLSTGVTRLHFDDLQRRYGPQTIVNLAELTGKESVVTNGFREVVSELNDEKVHYKEFDFHNQCKGMRYENISKLIDEVDGTFNEQGYYWTCEGVLMREQSGTFRVNCIDCLDRTAVVQSAFAHHVLISELTQVGVTPDSLNRDIDMVFNDIWANNGDAISRSYAGTSALKGDFTRTGKRDLTGMMNDGLNSLARMYSGAVSDFFAQAVISYMVGERSIAVFHEMIESLQSSDSSNLMRLSRIRAAAIEVSAARVIESGESFSNGWVFLAPEKAGVKFSLKMEEKILLLTKAAIYVVSFNYALEKVIDCTRIPLTAIKSIHRGAYIVKPLTEAGRDDQENAGFQIYFYPAAAETRLTTFSVLNYMPTTPTGLDEPPLLDRGQQYSHEDLGSVLASKTVSQYADTDTVEFFAFKALSRDFHTVDRAENDEEDRTQAETCKEVVERVVDRIREEIVRAKPGESRIGELVLEKDVIGLEEAEKQTSIMARADYALKKLLWLP